MGVWVCGCVGGWVVWVWGGVPANAFTDSSRASVGIAPGEGSGGGGGGALLRAIGGGSQNYTEEDSEDSEDSEDNSICKCKMMAKLAAGRRRRRMLGPRYWSTAKDESVKRENLAKKGLT